MFDFSTPYTDMVVADIKRTLSKIGSKPTVLHRMICPCCGKKLVNLYYSATQEKYICKTCLDTTLKKEGADNAE